MAGLTECATGKRPVQAKQKPCEGKDNYINQTSKWCPPELRNRNGWTSDSFIFKHALGKGCASHVYLVVHRASLLEMAIKVYNKNKLTPQLRSQVHREIQLHSSLQHDNIVQMYGAWEDRRAFYLLLEYAPRGDLLRHVHTVGGCYSEHFLINSIIKPFLSALTYLHSKMIVHRDIKPENCVMTADNVIKVTDFGLSCDLSTDVATTRLGTLDYMAPEVVKNPDNVAAPRERKDLQYGFPVDIWAVGTLAFELLIGQVPFNASNKVLRISNIQTLEPRFPSWMPPSCQAFITSALCKNPADRPTAKELARHEWLTGDSRAPSTIHSTCNHSNKPDILPDTPKAASPSSLLPTKPAAPPSVPQHHDTPPPASIPPLHPPPMIFPTCPLPPRIPSSPASSHAVPMHTSHLQSSTRSYSAISARSLEQQNKLNLVHKAPSNPSLPSSTNGLPSQATRQSDVNNTHENGTGTGVGSKGEDLNLGHDSMTSTDRPEGTVPGTNAQRPANDLVYDALPPHAMHQPSIHKRPGAHDAVFHRYGSNTKTNGAHTQGACTMDSSNTDGQHTSHAGLHPSALGYASVPANLLALDSETVYESQPESYTKSALVHSAPGHPERMCHATLPQDSHHVCSSSCRTPPEAGSLHIQHGFRVSNNPIRPHQNQRISTYDMDSKVTEDSTHAIPFSNPVNCRPESLTSVPECDISVDSTLFWPAAAQVPSITNPFMHHKPALPSNPPISSLTRALSPIIPPRAVPVGLDQWHPPVCLVGSDESASVSIHSASCPVSTTELRDARTYVVQMILAQENAASLFLHHCRHELPPGKGCVHNDPVSASSLVSLSARTSSTKTLLSTVPPSPVTVKPHGSPGRAAKRISVHSVASLSSTDPFETNRQADTPQTTLSVECMLKLEPGCRAKGRRKQYWRQQAASAPGQRVMPCTHTGTMKSVSSKRSLHS